MINTHSKMEMHAYLLGAWPFNHLHCFVSFGSPSSVLNPEGLGSLWLTREVFWGCSTSLDVRLLSPPRDWRRTKKSEFDCQVLCEVPSGSVQVYLKEGWEKTLIPGWWNRSVALCRLVSGKHPKRSTRLEGPARIRWSFRCAFSLNLHWSQWQPDLLGSGSESRPFAGTAASSFVVWRTKRIN